MNKKQKFYCKKCQKEFEIESEENFLNYKCPDCQVICQHKGYVGISFRIK